MEGLWPYTLPLRRGPHARVKYDPYDFDGKDGALQGTSPGQGYRHVTWRDPRLGPSPSADGPCPLEFYRVPALGRGVVMSFSAIPF